MKLKNIQKSLYRKLSLNSSRVHLDGFVSEAANSLTENSVMLDAGAGDSLYRKYFEHTTYESADFCQVDKYYGHINYVCELTDIPVDDDRYDMVLCTQVLEHLPEPKKVLREFNRVLRPGARLWLTAPLFYEEHETPYDFYRYTRYGFTYLLESANFEIERLEWLEGYFGTFAYQLEVAAKTLPLHPRDYGGGIKGLLACSLVAPLKPLFFIMSLLFARFDIINKYTNGGQCKNYAIVARKCVQS